MQTNDPSSLSVATPADFAGAVALDVSMSWTNADGSMGFVLGSNNVEAYAPGSPIFALSVDDHLTGSTGADLFVFAQPIGNNVIHNFDVAADRIDLIGFDGLADFANLAIANDANGNAAITISVGSTITIKGVDAALLTAANFLFDFDPVTVNTNTITLHDGSMMPFGGTVENSGTISLDSQGDQATLEILFRGVTLTGGGDLVLSDSSGNTIIGGASDSVLTNVDNTISGAGQLGAGQMTLANAGTILANGANALVIDTGSNRVTNTGVMQSTGIGNLIILSALLNTGSLWANGGNIVVQGDATGGGSATIGGAAMLAFGGASDQNVTFADGSGVLKLDVSAAFSGSVSGFVSGTSLELGDVVFGGNTVVYQANDAGTGGTLIVSDGASSAQIALVGQYQAAGLQAAGESGGTVVSHDAPAADHLLLGGAADDLLVGGDGNDILVGGAGADTMTGGAGSDTFKFLASDGGGTDTVTDFTVADTASGGDVLDLSELLVGSGATPETIAEFINLTASGADTVVSVDPDGAGAMPAQQIVTLQGVINLTLQQLIDNHQVVI
ncbi:MAG: hypothetical protein A3I63_08395 [Betaproteobacteria bacterium RIFCSPLOWO2_02_FULL_66_14]|nr:MAG: hypothetical protein A3I63_08395 [Betaproteobacteria bacterium RIFCSPLOWO2_02_FULL_66_14]